MNMLNKYLPFFLVLVTFRLIEAKLLDSVDFLSSLDLQLDQELPRVRRDESSSTPSEDDIWKQHLIKWATMIEKISERNFNISIIGWQDIYDSSGEIKAVNSVELAFPIRKDAEVSNILENVNHDDLHDRSVQHKVSKIFPVPDELKSQGVLLDVVVEAQDGHTDSPVLLHWTPTSTFFRPDGLVTLSKTQTATKGEVVKFIEKISLRESSLRPLILVYDENGKLKQDKVQIPDFSIDGYVVDSWQASDEVLLRSPKIMTEIALTFKQEKIPEQLGRRFNKDFPKYDWRVLVNPGKFLLHKDVWIKLSTDGFEFREEKKDIYLVYGIEI